MVNELELIYMDHAATTPLRPEVAAAMEPYWADYFGNPSSIHAVGRRAHSGLERARRELADILGTRPNELIFTGGGTESDNAALRGIALARREQTGAKRIVTSPVEHHAILHTAEDLQDHFGFELTLLPVNQAGLVDPDELKKELTSGDVAVVSVMYANNEIGTVQPIAAIGAHCRAAGVPFHSDGVQAAGKLSLKVDDLNLDALSLTGHKIYGPKGCGLLYLRRGTPFHPLLTGGSHEGGRRAGTENVPGIVGLAVALSLAEAERMEENQRLSVLRDRLIGGILEGVDGARLTGSRDERLANNASFVLPGVEAEGVLIGLDMAGIAASSGSACASASQTPSHVLSAIGISPVDATGALRLSLGHSNTPEQIDFVVEEVVRIVAQIQGTTPVAL